MHALDYATVSKYINECPNCGSGEVGDGFGSIGMKDPIIYRTCECGFNFKYDVDILGTKPKQIKQAVSESLSNC